MNMLILLLMSMSAVAFAQDRANPLDQYLGCYKTIQLGGQKFEDNKQPISTVGFYPNTNGAVFLDPETNKPLPYYKISLDSGSDMGDGTTYVFWSAAFLDRGKFIVNQDTVGYTYEGVLKMFADDAEKQYLMNILYNLEVKKLTADTIQIRTQVTNIGIGSDCRDFQDCVPIGTTALLKKTECK